MQDDLQRLSDIFKRFDADGNGVLDFAGKVRVARRIVTADIIVAEPKQGILSWHQSSQEVASGMSTITDKDIEPLFKHFDPAGSGYISFESFMSATAKEMTVVGAFRKFMQGLDGRNDLKRLWDIFQVRCMSLGAMPLVFVRVSDPVHMRPRENGALYCTFVSQFSPARRR